MKLYFGVYILLVALSSCGSDRIVDDKPGITGSNEYAKLFSLSDSGNYVRLDIFSPWQGADDIVISYYLSENISSIPSDIKESRKIKLPIDKCICLSTTHIAMIDAVGSLESIIGVSGTNYVSNTGLRERIEKGYVKDVGYDSNLNTELITTLDPDIVFVYGIGPESAGYISKLETVNIPALYICDYLEVHPLAKTEWIKLFGLLFGAEEGVNTLFTEVRNNYESIRDSIQTTITNTPGVMLGLPYKDNWFISPGNSYISTMIEDAGGEYIWADHKSDKSMPLSIESVFREALRSEYWLNIGNLTTSKELLAFDRRFAGLPPVQSGNLYNNVARLSRNGGNDYWESGAIRPDLILMDIASILHPDIIQNHELYYYLKVE